MIQISKIEADYLRTKLKNIPIKRTTHKYYVEDNAAVRAVLRRMPVKAVAVSC